MSFKKRVCAISIVAAVWSRPSRGLMTGTAGRRSIFPKISTMPSHIAGMTVGELFRDAKNEFVSGANPIDEVSSMRLESLRNSFFPQHRAPPVEPQWELHHDPVEVLKHSKAWVNGMVVGLRLCPFTRNADLAGVPPGHMRYEVSSATTIAGMHADACDSIGRFVDTDEEEVAALMVVFPQFTSDFLRFAVFTEVMQSFLTKVRFIQGLHFHPSYEFPTAGVSPEDMQFNEDAGRSTNCYSHRSPYPMLQILRTEMVARVELDDRKYEQLATDNAKKLAAVGEHKLRDMLDARDWSEMLLTNKIAKK